MVKLRGEVVLKGSVAYVPQTAYIVNASVKDNILFGLPFNQERYQTAIKAACLQADLDALPAGDTWMHVDACVCFCGRRLGGWCIADPWRPEPVCDRVVRDRVCV